LKAQKSSILIFFGKDYQISSVVVFSFIHLTFEQKSSKISYLRHRKNGRVS